MPQVLSYKKSKIIDEYFGHIRLLQLESGDSNDAMATKR